MSEFIKVGSRIYNTAHIITVEFDTHGDTVYIESVATATQTMSKDRFDGAPALALRFHFERCSTDIEVNYQRDIRYRKIASCVHQFPNDPPEMTDVCTKCHEDFAEIYG